MKKTVDFGIDLGTTNSAIARMRTTGPEIIKNIDDHDITPSAVAKTDRGQIVVGSKALGLASSNCAVQFKKLMGTAETVTFSNGESWSPEALSSEVLKELKASAKRQLNLEVLHAVITVPAMFSQPACEATQRAAELAGINVVALLQEPIAAASAYLTPASKEGHYLVYDLGGGTFDVSLVLLRSGELNVVAHGGNRDLGGSKFDKLLADWILSQIPGAPYNADALETIQRHTLLRICEDEKKRFSISRNAELDVDISDVGLAKDSIKISSDIFETLIDPLVTETIYDCNKRLQDSGKDLKDINSLLLVGGPTKSQFIRDRLKDELGLEIQLEDPMTVVARGAAIFASSKIVNIENDSIGQQQSLVFIEVEYEPVVSSDSTFVIIKPQDESNLSGEVRIFVTDGFSWDTGWLKSHDCRWESDLTLAPNLETTTFKIEFRDIGGTIHPVSQFKFSIRKGIRPSPPVVPYSLGIVLEDDRVKWLIRKDSSCPVTVRDVKFTAAVRVRQGSSDTLPIYLVEGESDQANENLKIGELLITGSSISQSISVGDEILVSLTIDESRLISGHVMIKKSDDEYKMEPHSVEHAGSLDEIKASINQLSYYIDIIEDECTAAEADLLVRIRKTFDTIEAMFDDHEETGSPPVEEISREIQRCREELRPLRQEHELTSRLNRAKNLCDIGTRLTEASGDSIDQAIFEDYMKQATTATRLNQKHEFETIYSKIRTLFWKHWGRTAQAWTEQVSILRERSHEVFDQANYLDLIRKAEQCIRDEDLDGARVYVFEAYEFLPDKERLRDRFYDAGLR